jgi:hypothetical protein
MNQIKKTFRISLDCISSCYIIIALTFWRKINLRQTGRFSFRNNIFHTTACGFRTRHFWLLLLMGDYDERQLTKPLPK